MRLRSCARSPANSDPLIPAGGASRLASARRKVMCPQRDTNRPCVPAIAARTSDCGWRARDTAGRPPSSSLRIPTRAVERRWAGGMSNLGFRPSSSSSSSVSSASSSSSVGSRLDDPPEEPPLPSLSPSSEAPSPVSWTTGVALAVGSEAGLGAGAGAGAGAGVGAGSSRPGGRIDSGLPAAIAIGAASTSRPAPASRPARTRMFIPQPPANQSHGPSAAEAVRPRPTMPSRARAARRLRPRRYAARCFAKSVSARVRYPLLPLP